MNDERPTVFIVDDDPSVREALASLLRSVGLTTKSFASAAEFLRAPRTDEPACLVLNVRMPGQSGLELQHDLSEEGVDLPIVFITGHGDIPMSVRAMKAGAVDFLAKPFRDEDLLDAIEAGLEKDRDRHLRIAALAGLNTRFATLSAREREVMVLVMTGRLNKQIAAELGISEVTVKIHRGQVMRKMEAASVAELIRMGDMLALNRRAGLRDNTKV